MRRLVAIAAAIACLGLASPVLAGPGDQDVPAGSFVYMRKADPRPAEGPGVAGKPSYVVLGGKAEILGALGLTPMSDAEQASVSADAESRPNRLTDMLNRSIASLGSSESTGQASLAGQSGTIIGGTVGRAMGSMQSALGTMRVALGGSQ